MVMFGIVSVLRFSQGVAAVAAPRTRRARLLIMKGAS
jgi:hypothetical protein